MRTNEGDCLSFILLVDVGKVLAFIASDIERVQRSFARPGSNRRCFSGKDGEHESGNARRGIGISRRMYFRRRADPEKRCEGLRLPGDEIVVHGLPSGYLARGCKKEAEYLLQDGRVKRNSEIMKATVDERPPVPIDSTASNTNSVGLD